MPDFTVEVDVQKCLCTETCIDFAPETFHVGPDDHAEAEDPPLNTLEEVLDAARNCPHEAITVKDESGTRIFPPAE